MTRAPKPLEAAKLYDYALRSLGSRAHSLGELRKKLQRRAAVPADIDEVMFRLKDLGYLNDSRFAEGFAASKLANEGQGRTRVLHELRKKQIAPKLAARVVEETYKNTDEAQLIQSYLERKYRGKSLPEFLAVESNLASAFRRLRYAGFSSGAAIRALRQYAERADELEYMDPGDPREAEE